jgi:aminoacrylate peracid reductase
MPKTIISPPNAPPPLAPYSPAVKAGGFIFVSGVLAIGPDGVVGAGDVERQTRYVIETIRYTLAEAGASLSDVVNNAIFLKDLADYPTFNRVYKEYFEKDYPARYCIKADMVRDEFLVEIATTAYLGQ